MGNPYRESGLWQKKRAGKRIGLTKDEDTILQSKSEPYTELGSSIRNYDPLLFSS